MKLWARRVHLLIAWLFVAAVVYQVYLIGLFLFAGAPINPHRDWGNSGVFFLAFLLPISALIARLPRGFIALTGALFGLYFVQWALGLPGMKEQQPYLAALHPVNALVIFVLGLTIARRAWSFARGAAEATASSA